MHPRPRLPIPLGRLLAVGVLLVLLLGGSPLAAQEALEIQEVAEGVYALVGETGQRSPANLGNNATFGAVVTSAGVVLIDAGGSRAGAMALDAALDRITDQPVRVVINTGGQDHRWLGNAYWAAQGAEIIASAAAAADQRKRASQQLSMLSALIGPALEGTEPLPATTTFEESHSFTLGGQTIDLRHLGPAHTPGDSVVWLPAKGTVFAGDIVFVDRLLGVLPVSASADWIAAFDALAALEPAHVVPGHGPATTLDQARADTRAYLAHLRAAVGAFLETGGAIQEVGTIDQTAFAHLTGFDSLAGRNAQQVYQEMEWE